MQKNNLEALIDNEHLLFPLTMQKTSKKRKWREIEDFKAKQNLRKELEEIDQSFDLTVTNLI